MRAPAVTILRGGTSNEREISQLSGEHLAEALAGEFEVELLTLEQDVLPASLEPSSTVVFPALHGGYGEDGSLQADLEAAGFAYAGCDSAASGLCIDKARAKERVLLAGVRCQPGITFEAAPDPAEISGELGTDLVLKPVDHGSSRGLAFIDGPGALEAALAGLRGGRWLVEARARGREMSVGLLGEQALGVVEVIPRSGHYDYAHKYTPGLTRKEAPADIPGALTERLRADALAAYLACGCRDFARADFILREDGVPAFLELNTIPGLSPESLLPRSAACFGYDFSALARAMLAPALERFATRKGGSVHAR